MAAASSSSSIISIHALLAESDGTASPGPPDRTISIHALLAESDDHCTHLFNCFTNFYPRSPCGERHVSTKGSYHTMANFYPRSPCGERHEALEAWLEMYNISIHALLAESDIFQCFVDHFQSYFYPRSPCGERQALAYEVMAWNDISIHALLAESD